MYGLLGVLAGLLKATKTCRGDADVHDVLCQGLGSCREKLRWLGGDTLDYTIQYFCLMSSLAAAPLAKPAILQSSIPPSPTHIPTGTVCFLRRDTHTGAPRSDPIHTHADHTDPHTKAHILVCTHEHSHRPAVLGPFPLLSYSLASTCRSSQPALTGLQMPIPGTSAPSAC